MTKQYTKEELIKAVTGSRGIMSRVAKKLKCNWMTAQTYINKYKEVREAFDAENEIYIDEAEEVLQHHLKIKDPGVAKYVCSTKGRKRGYNDKKEIEHSGELSGNITINITPMDEDVD